MIRKFLSNITDSTEYVEIIKLFDPETVFVKADLNKYIGIYSKYIPGCTNQNMIRVLVLSDIIALMRPNGEMLPKLNGISDNEQENKAIISAAYLARKWQPQNPFGPDVMENILNSIHDETVSTEARALLARSALNYVMPLVDYMRFKDGIVELSKYLLTIDKDTLEDVGELLSELQYEASEVQHEEVNADEG